ncbi:MAG: aldolase/citrate lyase family protein [Dorea sp.]|nr:aldolase/citrate lyase family protein [Dorea sp.]
MAENLLRTMMFVPGNNPGMIKDASIYGSDAIMFDLEDSVAVNQKDAARYLVQEALATIQYSTPVLVVRINDPREEWGRLDLEAIVPLNKVVIRLPKTETADDVVYCAQVITEIEERVGLPVGSTRMMAAIESAAGVLNAREIAHASDRLIAIALGAEDYVTNLKTTRSSDGVELLFGRSMLLHAAREAGLAAIDTVFSNVNDEEGLRRETELIHKLGFDGKSVINPRQIPVVHEIFTPSEKELNKAIAIMGAIKEANAKGSGVIALNGKMIDKPVVERAKRALRLAMAVGIHVDVDEEDL